MYVSNHNTYYRNYNASTSSTGKQIPTQANFSSNISNIYSPPLLLELNGKKPIISVTSAKGSISVIPDESYTDDAPNMYVKGVDSHGKQYEKTIDPRTVDPRNASSVEMAALVAYMIHTGQIDETEGHYNSLIYPYANPDSTTDIFDKIDFSSDIRQFSEWQKGRDTHETYEFLSDALMKMMDRVTENHDTPACKESEETNTEVFINPKGERVLMIKTSFGVRYIKIGEATDFLLTDNKIHENLEKTLETSYRI